MREAFAERPGRVLPIRSWRVGLLGLLALALISGCRQRLSANEEIMVELRTLVLEESDPDTGPATAAQRALVNLAALSHAGLVALTESASGTQLIQTLERMKRDDNSDIITRIRVLHTAGDSTVRGILDRLAARPVPRKGDPLEPLAARVVVMALDAM